MGIFAHEKPVGAITHTRLLFYHNTDKKTINYGCYFSCKCAFLCVFLWLFVNCQFFHKSGVIVL